jgi:hypothetical protein
MDPADFSSLLEREPMDESAKRKKEWTAAADVVGYSADALSSAAERIKSLEDVLVAIRVKLTAIDRGTAISAQRLVLRAIFDPLHEALDLISETLDPCKPWCVLPENHGGACTSDERMDERE